MTVWLGTEPLILASQSRARQGLLASAGIAFEAIPADIDERGLQQSTGTASPEQIAVLLARAKALAVSSRYRPRFVIGADQTLALGEHLFSKASSRTQAAAQLRALAGRTHELHSAIAIAYNGEILFSDVSVARMTMRALDDESISAYLEAAAEAVTTSVGAYQLEGLGVHLFERIEGDHFTILGLPLLPLLDFLRGRRLLAI